MTGKQKEKIAETSLSEMSKKVRDEYNKKTLPAPTNKAAIKAYRTKWQKTLDNKLAAIERREAAKHYDQHPDDYKKDWDDAYYARFIIRIQDSDWENYLKG